MNEYEIEQPNINVRKLIAFVLVFLILVVLASALYYENKANHAKTAESHPVTIQITKGSSTRQIANLLVENKLVDSPRIFMAYVYLHNAQSKIQAGKYALDSNMPITQIVDVLTNGRVVSNSRTVTLIEGLTNAQIGKILSQQNILNENDFEQTLANHFNTKYSAFEEKYSLQGFLFPDTYTFAKDATSNEIVEKMLKNFETKVTDKMAADAATEKGDLGTAIIMASIIEKEVGRNKQVITNDDTKALQQERELVASVFYNRLVVGMALESDATVNYITGKADRSVSIADTKIKSPYNTYQNKGLPPTPISNPGLGSIMAAIYPASSDYLYFLNAPDGTAYFAKTLAEHNANRAKYLK